MTPAEITAILELVQTFVGIAKDVVNDIEEQNHDKIVANLAAARDQAKTLSDKFGAAHDARLKASLAAIDEDIREIHGVPGVDRSVEETKP